jgi:ABC-type uncharacterized transport system substrate-binding protein/HAMP domain-containing protein
MYLIGVLSFTDDTIGEIPEIEQELNQLEYAVHLEQMRINIRSPKIGDFYYEKGAIILWLCRCFGDAERCERAVEAFIETGVDAILAMNRMAFDITCQVASGTGVPIIFAHITRDPESVTQLEQLQKTYKVTGVWDSWLDNAEERLALITEVVPPPTTVHAVYNPNLPTVVAEADLLRRTAKNLNLQLILHEAFDPKQVKEKIANLQTQQDHAILRLADPTTDKAASFMGAIAHEQNIPYVGLTVDELERCGALFALEVQGSGRLVARLIDRILNGEPPSSIPFALASKKTLAVNLQAAQDLSLIVSPAVLSKAEIILPAQQSTRLGTQFISIFILALFTIILTIALAHQFGFPYLYALTTGSALMLTLWILIYLNQRIISPIRKLAAAAEKIGSGELNTPIVDFKANNEVDILTRALRRMKSNLRSSYTTLDEKNKNLKEQLLELTQAYRSLQKTQRELELASRRIIEAEDSQRFALTTYIHDEIIRPLEDISAIAHELEHPDLIKLHEELEGRIRQVRFDLSVPILRDIGIELRRLAQETLPAIFPNASKVSMQLDLSALDQNPKLEPSCIFLIYRFVRGTISNVYRHSQATLMEVSAEICDGQLSLYVSDNGKGFDPLLIENFIKSGHYFFHDIQIRTRQLNGNFIVRSLPERGTQLQLSLPIARNMKKNRKSFIPRTIHRP